MQDFVTERESFWAGEFGDEYIVRNQSESLISSNLALFSKILSHTRCIKSVIEFGANIGLNLQAIKHLLPQTDLSAVEIDQKAGEILQQNNIHTVYS